MTTPELNVLVRMAGHLARRLAASQTGPCANEQRTAGMSLLLQGFVYETYLAAGSGAPEGSARALQMQNKALDALNAEIRKHIPSW